MAVVEPQKKHIAMVSPNGTSGDVRPMLAVAADLVERGHRVSFLANPAFQDLVSSSGAEFRAVGTKEAQQQLLAHPNVYAGPRALKTFFDGMVLPNVREINRQLTQLEHEGRVDAVFSHGVALGAQATAKLLDIPAVSAAYSPMVWPKEASVQPHLPGFRIPQWAAPFMYKVAEIASALLFDRAVRREYDELGLEFTRGAVTRELTGGRRHLGMWSPSFRQPSPKDPSRFATTGFAHFDKDFAGTHQLTDATLRFLLDHQNVVVFTLGTGVVHGQDKRAFYEQACEACRRLNLPGVLLIGKEENRPAPASLDKDMHVSLYEPLSLLLDSACLVVHQGGIGTTAEVLRAGKPSIIIPSAYDQHDTADRIANRLKLGGTLSWRELTPDTLELEVRRVLMDSEIRQNVSGIGFQIRTEDGPKNAADAILRVIL